MSIDQARQPTGTPVGGRFATTARPEPFLHLASDLATGPERDADAVLAASLVDAARLNARIVETRARLAAARQREVTAAALPDRGEDHLFWTERVTAAEDDLAELTSQLNRTVPGLAALATRHDRALRDLTEMASGRHPVDPESYAAAQQELRRTQAALQHAGDPDLTVVFGDDEMPTDLHRSWADVAMVAAPVMDPDAAKPVTWRVSFVDAGTGVELGRATVPAAHVRDHRTPDRLDKTAIATHVTRAAQHGDPTAAAVVAHLPGPVAEAA